MGDFLGISIIVPIAADTAIHTHRIAINRLIVHSVRDFPGSLFDAQK